MVVFQKLTEKDVSAIAAQLCETKVTGDAVSFMHQDSEGFRKLVVWLYRAEHLARTNGLKEVSAAHLRGWKK